MYVDVADLLCPRRPTVMSRNDRAVSADSPPALAIFGSEDDVVEMSLDAGHSLRPFLTAVSGRQDDAARADRYRAIFVLDIQTIESCVGGRLLAFPIITAVIRAQDRPVGADGPAVLFIFGEAYRGDGVALRQGVLPDPSASLRLSRARRSTKENAEG